MEKYYFNGKLRADSEDTDMAMTLLRSIAPDDPMQFPAKEYTPTGAAATYDGQMEYSYDIFDDLSALCDEASKQGIHVNAVLTYAGDAEGVIIIRNNKYTDFALFTAADALDKYLKIQESITTRYRENIRAYYDDHTEEGQLWKKAKMREDEGIMKDILSISDNDVYAVYDQEYASRYAKDGERP